MQAYSGGEKVPRHLVAKHKPLNLCLCYLSRTRHVNTVPTWQWYHPQALSSFQSTTKLIGLQSGNLGLTGLRWFSTF
jgi:hypothetical protein